MPGPTPDYDTVTVIWQRANDDRTAPQGTIYLKYDGGLRKGSDILIEAMEWDRKVRRTILMLPDKHGTPTRTIVGEAIFTDVPVSNDPDIEGGGGSYTIREDLADGTGRTYQFYADPDTPGGVIYVAPRGPDEPDQGTVYSVVTMADFTSLDERVEYLEANPGGGGGGEGTVTSVNGVEPVSGNVALTLADLDDVDAALDAKADLVGGLVPTAQLPPLTVTAVIVVADQSAMLASGAAVGTVAKRTDTGDSYILQTTPASTLGNWVSISTTSAVDSVAGKTGAVSLVVADVGGAQTELDRRRIAVYWTGSAWPAVGTVPTGTAVDFYSLDDPAATPPPLARGNDEWHRGF